MSEFYDEEFDPEEELDERLAEEPVKPPADMKLTVEVGLSEYSPNGLLELLARGLLVQLGGKDQWAALLKKQLLEQAEAKARALIDEVVTAAFLATAEGIDIPAMVEKETREFIKQEVDSDGKVKGQGYGGDRFQPRLKWMVQRIVKEAMDGAFKQAEAEWKASTTQAIKETLTGALADRLAKALPTPPELRG